MTVTRDVLNGVAALIVAGVPGTSFPNDTTRPVDGAIILKTMPDTPDRVIVLNLIPMTSEATLPMGMVMLQVATRGTRNNPLDVDDLADPIKDLLDGLTNRDFGAVHLSQCAWNSTIPMGQDETIRNERVDKFYCDLDVPPTNNRPATGW